MPDLKSNIHGHTYTSIENIIIYVPWVVGLGSLLTGSFWYVGFRTELASCNPDKNIMYVLVMLYCIAVVNIAIYRYIDILFHPYYSLILISLFACSIYR